MKKNFFKKLAFVLAFAMVATSIAPVSAGAATTPTIKGNAKQYLLLNDEADTSYDFNINNKVTGSKYSWSSSDEAVATVDSVGLVEAVGIGTAKITCKITFPTKKTKKLYATVIVKENMDSITIKNAPADAVGVNEVYDLNRDYTTVTGGKTTDITKWFITKGNDKNVASIDKDGKFVATEAGEYEVVARAYQSSAKFAADAADFTVESTPVTIKVVAKIASVKQISDKKVEVTFTGSAKADVTKDNLVITNSKTFVKQAVKSVTFADADAGLKATVETYLPFADAAEYTVAVTDKANYTGSFVASIGEVKTVEITGPATVVAGATDSTTVVSYKLYDANGVDVTAVAAGTVSIAITDGIGYYDSASKKITLFNVNDKVTLQATYNSGKYTENGTAITVPSEKYTVTAVSATATTVNGFAAYTITSGTPDFDKAPKNIAVGDAGYKIYVKSKDSNGNDVTAGFTYESTDNSKLIVNADGSVCPVAQGKVYVKVTQGNNTPFMIDFTVGAERKAASISFDKYSATLSNAAVADTATFEATVLDQYGDRMNDTVAYSLLSSTAFNPLQITNPAAGNTVSFNAQGVAEGTYQYKLTAKDLAKVVTITVKTPGAVSAYKLGLSGTTVNTKVDAADNFGPKAVTASLYSVDASGLKIADVTAVAGTTFLFEKADGTDVSTTASYSVVAADGQNVLTKAATGVYKVTASINGVVKAIGVFAVTDDQTAPVITQAKVTSAVAVNGTALDVAKDAFTAVIGTTDVTSAQFVAVDAVSANGTFTANTTTFASAGTYSVFVKTITIKESFTKNGQTYTFDHVVTVNKSVTVTVTAQAQ